MKISPHTKIDIMLALTIKDIQTLIPICKMGLPADIEDDMRSAIESLVCLAVNPLRPFPAIE